MTLQGQTALVTGGTRGIGRAVALLLAKSGVRVVCWYKTGDEAAQALVLEQPAIATARVDVADASAVKAGIQALVRDFAAPDILVNCAGIARDSLLAAMPEESWLSVIETGLTGVFHVCREVSREMIFQRRGRIVNLASLSGVTGLPAQTNYAAAKGGVIAFTKALAQELGRYGILVNAVSPGLIETDMLRDMPEARRREIVDRIPLGREGKPDEVARLVLFLASDQNTYITGQNFIICGGLYM